jgi:hypothetical protein
MLMLVCLALRPGLSDAAEGGSVSRPPYDYYAMAQNKNVHGDRETALKVINRNLNRASGTMEEKMEVPSVPPSRHTIVDQRLPAWAARRIGLPPQPPPHRPNPRPTSSLVRADGCSFTAPL